MSNYAPQRKKKPAHFAGTLVLGALLLQPLAGAAQTVPVSGLRSTPDVNEPPKAERDAVVTPEDTPVLVDVLANDTDADAIRILMLGRPSHGAATVVEGAVRYVPAPNYHGPDAFSYTVGDYGGFTAKAMVEVTVVPVNDAPAAVATIPDQTLDDGAGRPPVFSTRSYVFDLLLPVTGRSAAPVASVRARDPGRGPVIYALGAGDSRRFSVDPSTGAITWRGGNRDLLTRPQRYALIVTARNMHRLVAAAPVTVTLRAFPNRPPLFSARSYVFDLLLPMIGRASPVASVRARDLDRGPVIYALASDDSRRFSVDPSSGAIIWLGRTRDLLTGPQRYELTVTARNTRAFVAAAPVTITLRAFPEAR